jgi:hypothetical protein
MILLNKFTHVLRVSTESKISRIAMVVDYLSLSSNLLGSSSIRLHRHAVICCKHPLKFGSSHHWINNDILFFVYLVYWHWVLTISLFDIQLVFVKAHLSTKVLTLFHSCDMSRSYSLPFSFW